MDLLIPSREPTYMYSNCAVTSGYCPSRIDGNPSPPPYSKKRHIYSYAEDQRKFIWHMHGEMKHGWTGVLKALVKKFGNILERTEEDIEACCYAMRRSGYRHPYTEDEKDFIRRIYPEMENDWSGILEMFVNQFGHIPERTETSIKNCYYGMQRPRCKLPPDTKKRRLCRFADAERAFIWHMCLGKKKNNWTENLNMFVDKFGNIPERTEKSIKNCFADMQRKKYMLPQTASYIILSKK